MHQEGYCSYCKAFTFPKVDLAHGVMVCQICGLITERLIDQTQEYRQFSSENSSGVDRSRVGALRDDSRDDSGLSLAINSSSSNRNSSTLAAMSTRLSSNEDISLVKAQKLIRTWGSLLNLKENTLGKAKEQLLKIESKKKSFKGRSIESVVAAVIYIACRMCSVPLKSHDIEGASGVASEDIKRAYNAVKGYVDPIPSLESSRYCSIFCAKLGVSQKLSSTAFKIAEDIKEKRYLDGKNPRTVASVAMYIAIILLNEENCTIKMVADMAKISESTIKKSYNEIYSKYKNVSFN